VGSYQEISTKFEISKEELLKSGPEAYFSRVPQIAKEWSEKQAQLFFKKMDEIVEATGNVVDAKSRPLSPSLYLAALDTVAMSFDEFGNPNLPSLFLHPDKAEKMKEEFQKLETNSILKLKFNLLRKLIIDKKRQDWVDRESNRKLVD
jgi:hypothetical protein